MTTSTSAGMQAAARRAVLALVLALAIAVAGPALAQAHKGHKQADSEKQFYVSLGDSYSIGYQPGPPGQIGTGTTDGYANQLPKLAHKRGYRFKLVNFGCGGETTTSILSRVTACPVGALEGHPVYTGQTQAAAAEAFLRKHRGDVGLVTVSIGGNDVIACASSSDPFGCVATAVETIKANLATLTQGLRDAAGAKVKVVGLTYPDVLLGLWVSGSPDDQDRARQSLVALQQFINPALKGAYEAAQGSFVDVTAATGAYIPLEQTTVTAAYGEIPVAVATVCEISWFCDRGDIHLKASGYLEMAKLIADTLPKKGKRH
jgi:lysophospholipase L1-like esterase